MRIPSMFKTPKHRTFNYKPVVYDERKEKKQKLDELVEAQKKGEISDEVRQARLRKIFGGRYANPTINRKKESRNRMVRLLAIVSGLSVVAWKLLRLADQF